MVGTAASEYQLTGNVSLDDGFQAASSPNRLSRLDPSATFGTQIHGRKADSENRDL